MKALSIRLPQSVHRRLAELAKREGISINQFVNSAVAEKLAALMTEDYLARRAARGSKAEFSRVLARVADIEPSDIDRLPDSRVVSSSEDGAG